MHFHTLTRAPFSGAPFGSTGGSSAPLTGQSMTLTTDAPDARLGAWFFDTQTLTLMVGDKITAHMRKIDRATQAVDNGSGTNSTFSGGDASLADIVPSGADVTITAKKEGRASFTLTSGDKTVTGTIIIIVTPKPTPKPAVIIRQPPATVSLQEGEAISVDVEATGATAYQWQKLNADGSTWADVNGATHPALSAAMAVPGDNGTYHVVISGEPGSADVTSTNCVITVSPKVVIVTPKPAVITLQPVATIAGFVGHAFSLTVAATGATAYQWQKLNGSNWEDLPGATASTFSRSAPALTDSGSYRANIKGEAGSIDVQSTVCVVTITAPDHLNLVHTGTGTGTLTPYAGGVQSLSLKVGDSYDMTVQRLPDGSATPVSNGGNGFKIISSGTVATAAPTILASDTNKRTLHVEGVAVGTSVIRLTSADGAAALTLNVTVTAATTVTAKPATAVSINDITNSKNGGLVGAKMKGLHLGKSKTDATDEYYYTVTPADASGYSLAWGVVNGTGEATIDPVTGDITCVKVGKVTLQLTLTNHDGSKLPVATEEYEILSGWAITTPHIPNMKIGDKLNYKTVNDGIHGGTDTPDNVLKNIIGNVTYTFTSGDVTLATIDQDGLITALAATDSVSMRADVVIVSNGKTFPTVHDSSGLKITAK